ncbi:hypothetical protein BDN72DRAFT_297962 [Pluteus cervinus]|uniref:Uncharacterized protein n=1 Tax=Pluteus cervinus TaxID=181527 RepID=A0ACD3AE99_9AGAR|nr:hypothetical protein BDN72DRAFT_297962 [Pluteus cervinus]
MLSERRLGVVRSLTAFPGNLTSKKALYQATYPPSSTMTSARSTSNPSYTPSIDYPSQYAVDLEICRLLETIRELWLARNALAPISRLPPEVLVQIFAWLQDMYRHDLYFYYWHHHSYSRDFLEVKWMRVTQVYGYWRRVARGFPGLWNKTDPFWSGKSFICPLPLQLTVEPQYTTNMAPTSPITNSIASHNFATINFIAPVYYTSQSAIDLDISRLLGRIHELWSERNARAPISQLPPEVVVQIFGWLQTMYRNDSESKRETRRMRYTFNHDEGRKDSLEIKWTSVTQVYGYWRRIARGSPSLWNRIMLGNSFWLGESLTCSHPLPLILEAKDMDTFHNMNRLVQLRKAMASLPRVRIFDVSLRSGSHEPLSSLLSQPAPNLEVFKAEGHWSLRIPDDTFKGVSPNLRHVALCTVSLAWHKATFLKNLTSLTIRSSTPLRIDTLADILRRMPALITLDLEDIINEMDEDEMDTSAHISCPKPVHLPALESFLFRGCCFHWDYTFITCLRFPGRTQVKFYSTPDPDFPSSVNTVPQILDTFIEARIGDVIPIRSINLHYEFEETFTFAWTSTVLSSKQPYPSVSFSRSPRNYSTNVDINPPSSSSVSTDLHDSPDLLAKDWALQLSSLPLSSLEVFRTNIEVTPGTLWTRIFKNLPKLREIFLDGSSGAFLLQHLIENHLTSAAAPPTASKCITLPSLRRIHLNETDYTHVPIQLHCLAPAFAARKLDGSPIHAITFTNQECHEFKQLQDLVEELKTIVDEVEWDLMGFDEDDGDDFY